MSLLQSDSNAANNTFALVTHILPGVSVTVLSATPNSVNPGDAVDFSVTVVSPAGGQPSGTVTFREGTTDLGVQTLDASGKATISKSLISPGVHTVTAIYSGDSNFATSSMPIDVTVSGAAADSADLSLEANASLNSVLVGQTLSYTFTVTNNGPGAATNVTISHTLPTNVAFVSANASPGGTATQSAGIVTANFPSIAFGDSATVTIDVTPSTAGSLQLSASVSSPTGDPNSANNSASAPVTVNQPQVPTANIGVSIGSSAGSVLQGSSVTFSVTATNSGPDPARGVTLTVTLPAGLAFMSTTQGSQSNGVITVPLGDMALGANTTVTIVAQATGLGALQVSAAVADSGPSDPTTSNNSASATVTSNPPAANIGVSIGSSANSIIEGSNVTFTVMVNNAGPEAAQGVTLTVTLPAGLAFMSTSQGSQSNGVITVPLGDMVLGANTTVTIVAQATGLGSLHVTASVADSGPSDPTPSNNSASATVTSSPPNADLSVVLTADHQAIAQGSQITYTATVKNNGPLDAQNVTLTVNLPAGATFVSSTVGTNENGLVTAPLGPLAAGSQSIIRIVVDAASAGSLLTMAQVAAASPDDLDSSNNTSSTSVTSNAPITLTRTIDISVGTIQTPSYSGFASADAFAILGLSSTEVINAILNSPGLDPRIAHGLTSLRDAGQANPATLAYFEATTNQTGAVFGNVVQKLAAQATATDAFDALAQSYLQRVTAGAGSLSFDADLAQQPIVLSFPAITDAASGQVRNGELTVNVVVRNATIDGPIGTSTQLVASPLKVAPGQDVTLIATVTGNGVVHPMASGVSSPPAPFPLNPLFQVVFQEGNQSIGIGTINPDGTVTITTSSLAPGHHLITAYYSGDPHFAPSDSNTVDVFVGSLDGPSITDVSRYGYHMHPTTLVVTFSAALDPTRAGPLKLPPGPSRPRWPIWNAR